MAEIIIDALDADDIVIDSATVTATTTPQTFSIPTLFPTLGAGNFRFRATTALTSTYIGFSIADLFNSGEVGILAENTDTDTLFQDPNGASPLTTAGQTAALSLEKSQGLALEGEEISNTDFSTDTIWTYNANNNISGGLLNFPGGGGFAAQTGLSISPGWYALTINTATLAAPLDFIQLRNGGAAGTVVATFPAPTSTGVSVVYVYVPSSVDAIRLSASSGTDTSLNSISLKQLLGNHAAQSGSSFRPQYQAAGLLYDGLDDRMVTFLNPTTSGSIIARFNGDTASRVIAGSQAASDGRCFLALDASGRLSAGVGAQSTATIFGGADIRTETHVGAVTWDGSTVKLYLDGTEVYSAAQSGAVNTTVPIMRGALNANATAAAFWDGSISDVIVLDRVMTPTEITDTTNIWSA